MTRSPFDHFPAGESNRPRGLPSYCYRYSVRNPTSLSSNSRIGESPK